MTYNGLPDHVIRMKAVLILLVILLGSVTLYAQQVEIAFRITEKDLIPEGIAYDATSKSFFVSSIHKNKILRIDELNNELKLRRDIDALLNQFDDESQLSSVLDFCVSISSKKPEPCHEPE